MYHAQQSATHSRCRHCAWKTGWLLSGLILKQGAEQSSSSKASMNPKPQTPSWLGSSHIMSELDKTLSPRGSNGSEVLWTPEAERKLVRKIDFCLLPILWIMNLLSWMDRANLGNANIAGLTSDLRLSSSQFSLAVTTYYCKSILYFIPTSIFTRILTTSVGYMAWIPFSSLIISRTRPSLYLPSIMLLWGVVTASISAVKTYPQLLVMRVFMGILESGLTPGMVFIFSSWYTPHEIGKRSSWFLTSAQFGGLFGGLIAGGLMANLEGARGIRGWRWLFAIEGAITVAFALMAYFVLPDYPQSSRRFSAGEKHMATARLQRAGTDVGGNESTPRLGLVATMSEALKNWKMWTISLATAVSKPRGG